MEAQISDKLNNTIGMTCFSLFFLLLLMYIIDERNSEFLTTVRNCKTRLINK